MKKITRFLDSVMGGIKRTCIAKALAVFAVASIAINANAQTVNAASVSRNYTPLKVWDANVSAKSAAAIFAHWWV